MSNVSLPSEEVIRETITFCEKFPQPFAAVLFGVMVAQQSGLPLPFAKPKDALDVTDLPWVDLTEEKIRRIKALGRSVEVAPGELQKVYEFREDDVTVIAEQSTLGPTAKAKMQNAVLLYAFARKQVYGDSAVPWSNVRAACKDAGIEDTGGNFAAYMRGEDFPGEYSKEADASLSLSGQVTARAREVLKRLAKGDAS